MSSLYKRTEIIGRGKFGVVYKGYNKQTKQVVAIKVLNLDTQDDEVNEVQQEIAFLTELKTVPNVTHYYGSFLNDTRLWIIMDYCAGGSVRTLLKAGVFEERYIGVVVRELLYALSAVHKLGVIHRDLKSANVLITKNGNVQLCDFGVAAKITSNALKRTTMAGTPYWMAPEVIREGDTYNSKADIWSLGITIYEIATGNPPYCDKESKWAMQLISKSQPPRLEGREYSASLKECIALCLDENPDERPSADDLMKCKFVRFYKNHTKSILKEVITRYLLWRDRNSSRDSVFLQVDDRDDKLDGADVDQGQVHVKWDFDSLSSREYIIENDIDMDQVEEMGYRDEPSDSYQTLTLQGSRNNTYTTSNLGTVTAQASQKQPKEIPKSLQMLFEDQDETDAGPTTVSSYEPPTMSSYDRVDSPTIEIPDMDSLTYNATTTTSNSTHPPLNKPPALYHSRSASASLESRFTNTNGRTRKNTISTTAGSTSSSTNVHTPHNSPYANGSLKTPSPKPPPTTSLMASGGPVSSSPSKSMKALNSVSNPLLQPINFKLPGEPTNTASAANILPQAPSQASNGTNQNTGTSSTSNTINSLNPSAMKSAKRKPGFHIQMPTPSASFNALSALTNEGIRKDEVNQFGINPAQAANLSISMTPVTEGTPGSKDSEPIGPGSTRERAETVSNLRPIPRKMTSTVAADLHSGQMNTLTIPRANSVSGYYSGTGSSPTTQPPLAIKFPTIPPVNGEFFIDTTPKLKLVNELESMIKLFNQGLDALEDRL